jgi:hypothetical protein
MRVLGFHNVSSALSPFGEKGVVALKHQGRNAKQTKAVGKHYLTEFHSTCLWSI